MHLDILYNAKLGLVFLFFVFTLSCEILSFQPPDTLWTKTFGGTNIDVGYCVQQTTDLGFIITGYTRSYGTMSGRNVLLIKTDMFGNVQWINAFGGNNDEEGSAVQQTRDGGYIIAGYTKSFGSGLKDVYLIKADSLGNSLWSKTFGGGEDDEAYSIQETNEGGLIIAGATSSFGAGSRDVWLIKTDASGNEAWRKTLGGLSSDGAMSVQQTTDRGFIITGWTFSQGPGAVGNALLLKTDSHGNQQWSKAFGGSDVDRGLSVQQTRDGGYIFTGYTASFGFGLYDLYLVKTDSLGNEVWSKTFGGSGRDYGNSIQQTSDGGFIIAGYTLSFGAGNEDVWLVKTDSAGSLEWSKTFGGPYSDVGYWVRETSDGGYIITGHTLSFGAGVHDVWLIRTATLIPVELVSFTANIIGSDVVLNWLTASEKNNMGFEIERGKKQEVRSEMWEIIGVVEGKGTTIQTSSYSFEDKNLSAGKYNYRLRQIDFDGTSRYYNLNDTIEITTPGKFELFQNYPNPFNPVTTIGYVLKEKSNVKITVINSIGEEVALLVNEEKEPGYHTVEFNAKDLSSSVYFYKMKADSYIEMKKMILMK